MVKKACSTFVAFFADVSRKGMPSWSANSYDIICKYFSTPTKAAAHLRDAVLHNFLAGQVGLVSDKELVDALRSISLNLLEPLLDIRESIWVIPA